VILIAASVFLSQKSYTVLYSGMDPSDAGEMLSVLEDMGIDAKAEGSNTILVESSQADTVRMQLAAEGYPKKRF
jgi:flagellar M-ring protein FliF